jgi:hypothetical protein
MQIHFTRRTRRGTKRFALFVCGLRSDQAHEGNADGMSDVFVWDNWFNNYDANIVILAVFA